MKVSTALYCRSTDFLNLAEQLTADVEQLRLEKQTAFEARPEEWRNSEQGYSKTTSRSSKISTAPWRPSFTNCAIYSPPKPNAKDGS